MIRRPRRYVDTAEELDRPVAVAGLFVELTGGTGDSVLTGDVEHPGRDLCQHVSDGRAELPNQQDVPVGGDRNHRRSARLDDELPGADLGPLLDVHPQEGALVDGARRIRTEHGRA